jgi:hypothetical protein
MLQMKKTNYYLSEEDCKPFILDQEGNELEVGDTVISNGVDYRITKILCGGEIDQPPILQLTKVTYRTSDELIRTKEKV